MMRRMMGLLVLLTVAASIAVPASAQTPREHRGFWISFGLGGGWNLSRNVGVDSSSTGGGAAYLRMGGTLSEKFLLGGEVIGWGRSVDGAELARGNVNVTAMFYPSVQTGVFIKGGVGGASLAQTVTAGNTTTTVSDEGFGVTIGLGWDVRLARNFFLTPGLDFLYQRASSIDNTMLLMTVGATWH